MEDAIVVRYVFDKKAMRDVAADVMNSNIRLRMRLPAGVVALAVGIWAVLLNWNGAHEDYCLYALPVILMGLVLVSYPLYMRFFMMRQFRKSRLMDTPRVFTATAGGMRTEGGAGDATFSGEFKWPVVMRVVEGRRGFLLYPTNRTFHWLPFSGFAGAEDVEKFRALVRTAGVKMKGRPASSR